MVEWEETTVPMMEYSQVTANDLALETAENCRALELGLESDSSVSTSPLRNEESSRRFVYLGLHTIAKIREAIG